MLLLSWLGSLLQLALQVLDIVDRGQDGVQVGRGRRGHHRPQPGELLVDGDVHQHLPLHLLHLAVCLLPDCCPLLPQAWGVCRGIGVGLGWLLHANHPSSEIFIIWDLKVPQGADSMLSQLQLIWVQLLTALYQLPAGAALPLVGIITCGNQSIWLVECRCGRVKLLRHSNP